MAKTCPKCGNELTEDEIFCGKCGAIYKEDLPNEQAVNINACTSVKKRKTILWISAVVIALVVCSAICLIPKESSKPSSYTENSDEIYTDEFDDYQADESYFDNNDDEEITAPSTDAGIQVAFDDIIDMDENTIAEFINGERSFVDFETNLMATIYTLPEINDQYMGDAGMYAVIDLDNDGVWELLVEYNLNGDTAILHLQDGKCIAYYIPFRGRTGLKKDGTMSWSNSAFESGVQRITFSNSGIDSVDTIVHNTDENIFLIDGVNVSQEECENALMYQYEKEDVEWIPIQ